MLRNRIAAAIRGAAADQVYWVPGPWLAGVYADAVIAELGLAEEKPKYCLRCGIPHDGECLRDE